MKPLSNKAVAKINTAITRFKARARFLTLGPLGVSREELRDLIRSGWIKGTEKVASPVLTSYLLTNKQTTEAHLNEAQIMEDDEDVERAKNARPIVASSSSPQAKTSQRAALDFLERTMGRYIDKSTDQLTADIMSSVEGALMPIIDRREGAAIYEALQDKDLYSKNLRGLLNDKVENWQYRWRTIIGTELNRASNWGAMDAILANNPAMGPHELMVYKQGNKPGHGACKYCAKFWYLEDGITPRVYLMSELAANGSNIGRKAKDWMPTVDSTHPRETHIMREIKVGFGFVNGSLEYIGKNHNEIKNQQA